jgi:uncharacterized membrane protein YheB (UPF0754 family)
MEVERLQLLIDKFTSHQQTHPVLSKLWIESLETCKVKLQSIKKMIEQGETLIEKMPHDVNDPNISTILFLMSSILSEHNH